MERCFEGVVVVQCKTLIMYSVFVRLPLKLPPSGCCICHVRRARFVPKVTPSGGASTPYGHGKGHGRPWVFTTAFHLGCTGAVVHLCTAAQGFSPIFEAAPLWCGDHRSVVGCEPWDITRPMPLSHDSTVRPTDGNGTHVTLKYIMP